MKTYMDRPIGLLLKVGISVAALGAIILLAALAGGCDHQHSHTYIAYDRTGPGLQVSRGDRPLALSGRSLSVGDKAPDAVVRTTRWRDVRISDYRGEVVILSVVPELGTRVCDLTTRTLDEKAPRLPDDVAILTVSTDTSAHQQDWASANEIDYVVLLSDAARRDFGEAYGLTIEGSDDLMRAMIVIDREGVIRHIEVPAEIGQEPGIGRAVEVARKLAG